jgi:hypothetical protein
MDLNHHGEFMAKKIFKTGIKRDSRHMYFVKNGAVYAVPMKRKGVRKGAKVKLKQFADKNELDYGKNMYFVDKDGDVAMVARGRKKKAKKKGKK